ncbi:nuclease-like protein [Desulfitobacterium dichloroeliminans LMG P-21439]|uniref:Nuclease-like protein n=1 Tax=Desulfitobacterium dichloroeliminans (strain LMG P-21439 / DCA1) TaxID=871963 RepID=L0F5R8_DESDL|nr:nuclease-related domain-containing protein [Desulfitobacterium dichloroeliminans]AGA69174.1 nuclease-like protein [Desulfitobacterium dichloroeliminans LMG P-21439]
MLFRKRKEEKKINAPKSEIHEKSLKCRKYKSNYYSKNSIRNRESLRSKRQRKDEIGEYKLEVELSHLPQRFKLISSVLLNTKGGYVQIDHLLVSPYGLFVIEAYNLSGLIVGEENDLKWYQMITWRVKTFPNPVIENQARIEVLREQAGLDEDIPVFSYVTFNCRSNLKVFLSSVFYDIDLLASIMKLAQTQPVVLSDEEVLGVLEAIESINVKDQGIRNEYAARLRKMRMQERPKHGDIRCCLCQKAVNTRMARYCLNRPDKFAWKVYCEKHQKEMTKIVRRESIRSEEFT